MIVIDTEKTDKYLNTTKSIYDIDAPRNYFNKSNIHQISMTLKQMRNSKGFVKNSVNNTAITQASKVKSNNWKNLNMSQNLQDISPKKIRDSNNQNETLDFIPQISTSFSTLS